MKQIFVVLFSLVALMSSAQEKKVVVFDLKEDIAPAASRMTAKAVELAEEMNADLILVHMNTYGGYVTDADSIRSRLLNTKIPVYVFIDNNAASAGALISLACDKIYMRPGAAIGATTVVDQSGAKAPDKYQSYMRKQMRSTAESHGIDTIMNGDTIWVRNPDIAEGMVDESMVVAGLDDSSKVITLTTEEALKWGYCEGKAESLEEILEINGITDYQITKVKKTTLDKLVAFFANPALRSVLILLMLGGIYFEFQSPGIGFPIAVSVVAALAYFAPLYLEGLADNWEILAFIIGLVLIAVEIFVIPGFGVAGVSGILLVLGSLVLSMIANVNFDFSGTDTVQVNNALASLFFAMVGLAVLVYFFGRNILKSKAFSRLIIHDTLEGRVPTQVEAEHLDNIIGQIGTAKTALRPMGRIEIDGVNYEAKTNGEFIDSGVKIVVTEVTNFFVVVKENK
jgi:membrane-bound serine protease (ClpP class)